MVFTGRLHVLIETRNKLKFLIRVYNDSYCFNIGLSIFMRGPVKISSALILARIIEENKEDQEVINAIAK